MLFSSVSSFGANRRYLPPHKIVDTNHSTLQPMVHRFSGVEGLELRTSLYEMNITIGRTAAWTIGSSGA
jgi:hypothetical protein